MTKHERTLDLICRMVEAQGHDGAWPRIHGMTVLMVTGHDDVTEIAKAAMCATWDLKCMLRYLDYKIDHKIDALIDYRKKEEARKKATAETNAALENISFNESEQVVAKAEQEQKPCTAQEQMQSNIECWLGKATKAMEASHQREWGTPMRASYRKLRKYYKIIRDDSVYAFVDFDGYIYKAAGANAPAKGARGHIDKIDPCKVSHSTHWLYRK